MGGGGGETEDGTIYSGILYYIDHNRDPSRGHRAALRDCCPPAQSDSPIEQNRT